MGPCCSRKVAMKKAAYRQDNAGDLVKALLPKLDEWHGDAVVLQVGLDECNHLPDPDSSFSSLNPYVEIRLIPGTGIGGEQKQYSSIKAATDHPSWEPPERFMYLISNQKNPALIVSVYDYNEDKPEESTPIGDAKIVLKNYMSDLTRIPKRFTFDLKYPKTGKNRGEVQLLMRLISPDEAAGTRREIIYQYERWRPISGWGSSRPGHFLPRDPGAWSTADGLTFDDTLDKVSRPFDAEWDVTEHWSVMRTDHDPDGWTYASDFTDTFWYASSSDGITLCVRRRIWQRELRKKGTYEHLPHISNFNAAAEVDALQRKSSLRTSLVDGMKRMRNSFRRGSRRGSATSAASAIDHHAAAKKKNDDYEPPQLNPMVNSSNAADQPNDQRVHSIEGIQFTDGATAGTGAKKTTGQRRQRLFNS